MVATRGDHGQPARCSFQRMSAPIVVIREYANEMEAIIARSVLEAHDIPATILRDNAGGMLPAMQLLFPTRLAVAAHDRLAALAILDAPPVEPGEDDRDRTDGTGDEGGRRGGDGVVP